MKISQHDNPQPTTSQQKQFVTPQPQRKTLSPKNNSTKGNTSQNGIHSTLHPSHHHHITHTTVFMPTSHANPKQILQPLPTYRKVSIPPPNIAVVGKNQFNSCSIPHIRFKKNTHENNQQVPILSQRTYNIQHRKEQDKKEQISQILFLRQENKRLLEDNVKLKMQNENIMEKLEEVMGKSRRDTFYTVYDEEKETEVLEVEKQRTSRIKRIKSQNQLTIEAIQRRKRTHDRHLINCCSACRNKILPSKQKPLNSYPSTKTSNHHFYHPNEPPIHSIHEQGNLNSRIQQLKQENNWLKQQTSLLKKI